MVNMIGASFTLLKNFFTSLTFRLLLCQEIQNKSLLSVQIIDFKGVL